MKKRDSQQKALVYFNDVLIGTTEAICRTGEEKQVSWEPEPSPVQIEITFSYEKDGIFYFLGDKIELSYKTYDPEELKILRSLKPGDKGTINAPI